MPLPGIEPTRISSRRKEQSLRPLGHALILKVVMFQVKSHVLYMYTHIHVHITDAGNIVLVSCTIGYNYISKEIVKVRY
jgi:hypothetical protein